MQEEHSLSDTPKRCRPELVRACSTLNNVVCEVRSHVVHEQIRKQVHRAIFQDRAVHDRGRLHLRRMAQTTTGIVEDLPALLCAGTWIGVRLRAAYHLASEHLARGELAEAAEVAHRGAEWAEAEGLGLAPFGLDLQHLHFQAHFADGCWDHAQELADEFPIRVTRQAEALLSAMALFVDVARGNPAVGERRTWLEPFWNDIFVAYIARGILAEHALWQGDCEGALAEAGAAIDADAWPAHSPSVIRVTAIALGARADRAERLRVAGDPAGADAEAAAGEALLAVAREGASFPARPRAVLGLPYS